MARILHHPSGRLPEAAARKAPGTISETATLDSRIAALEQEAETMRLRILRENPESIPGLSVCAEMRSFGLRALALVRETVRQTDARPRPSDAEIDGQLSRIEVAYHGVHTALQAVAALVLDEGPIFSA